MARPVYLYPMPPSRYYVAAVSCRCKRAPARCADCNRLMRANHVHVYTGAYPVERVTCPRCADDSGAC